jgi:hypothetical protein
MLAYLPDVAQVGSLESLGSGLWRSPRADTKEQTYRQCANYAEQQVCNWAVVASDPRGLCVSCRLTRVIPNLDTPERREAWYRLEVAKRRLVYTLLSLKLPLLNRQDDPVSGLAFDFLADDSSEDQTPVLTGHTDGVITVNIAEANDAERERRKAQLRETYRTLLGHFRHESGHYYWDRLIKQDKRLADFRDVFGDERQDYAQAIQEHYKTGPVPNWHERFVNSYAGAHPWEDWAETWAHYLHMTDTLETAAVCGISIQPGRADEPVLREVARRAGSPSASFDRLIDSWFPLTYVLNSLNRGLGLQDAYPFVLSTAVIAKLRFVHATVAAASAARVRPEQMANKRTLAATATPDFVA